MNTADVVVITAVVCVLCSFTAGLLLGVVLNQCYGKYWKQKTSGETERPPVYEDIQPNKRVGIELQQNEAYGHIKL